MKTCITNNKKCFVYAAVCIFWIIIWQVSSMIVGKPLILPSPLDTAKALFALSYDRSFYLDIGWTMSRCLISMVLSLIAGALCGAAAYRFNTVRSILSLPVGFFKSVPVMAIIIYVILITSAEWVAVIVCFLMCFPIVYTNILAGLMSMGREYVELAYIYKLPLSDRIRLIYIPAIMPHINASLRLIAGLSWKAVVAAEVLSIPRYSLGYEMINSKYYLRTPDLFAYILVIVALSIAVERLIVMWAGRTRPSDYCGSRLVGKSKNKKHVELCQVSSEKNPAPAPAIQIKGICKSYGEESVLKNVNLALESGSVTIIEGPSGIGKTTLARILAGLEKPDSGTVEGDSIKTSFLFQEDRLLPWLNVYDNLAIGIPLDRRYDDKKILQMADALEIKDVLWCLPDKLSGGMKHRVALGRTFLSPCNLMILDEPYRGLDRSLRERITQKLWKKVTKDKTVIVITHNPQDFSEKTLQMQKISQEIFNG